MSDLPRVPETDTSAVTLTVEEAAAVLGQQPDMVLRYILTNQLLFLRVQGPHAVEYRLRLSDVRDFQARLQAKPNTTRGGPVIDQEGRTDPALPPARPETALLPAPAGWEDVLKSMQDMLGRLLETFAAANEGLLAENRRLHDQLLTQAESLGKGQAERERLQSQLAVVPSEIQLLTERLSAMQQEMQRLHSVNAQVVEEAVRAATQELRRRPWWVRLFGR